MTVRHGASDRGGFTLVELAVSVMIVGILAGIAIPAINYAILKADATRLVSDANTIRLAAHQYIADNGTFPTGYSSGSPPAALAPYLPDNTSWQYKDVTYSWFGITLPNANNTFRSRYLGLLIFDYRNRQEMATPMRAHQGPGAVWGPTQFYFVITG